MSEEPTVKIVLCPFNYGKGCTRDACGVWDPINNRCSIASLAEGITALVTILDAWPRPPASRKRPPKKEEPPKE